MARLTRTYSRRYEDRTGEPTTAYVHPNGFVIEKFVRDWDIGAGAIGAAGNPNYRVWWEVRRQGSNTLPGVSIGRIELFDAPTLRECREWCDKQTPA